MDLTILPSINASLNASSAVLLIAGYLLIRKKAITGHMFCMLSAFGTSILFLVSYLYYHAHHGVTKFQGQGMVRTAYFTILTTHTILAVVIVPLIIMTLRRAFKGDLSKHKAIARATLPLWLYVSVTGVVIYWMLYRIIY